MKIRVWYHVQDNGDGGATPFFFKSEQEAQDAAIEEEEEMGYGLCDNVDSVVLTVEDYQEVK
jgi:hypothetical protein